MRKDTKGSPWVQRFQDGALRGSGVYLELSVGSERESPLRFEQCPAVFRCPFWIVNRVACGLLPKEEWSAS